MDNLIKQNVRDYYGETLETNQDLKTNACCLAEETPRHIREILAELKDEVVEKFYGCGSPIPFALKGATVLDLGCGSGRDVFVLSKLVGPEGRVIGVDMTEQQLQVARDAIDYHTERFGYDKPNVSFLKGEIEDLESIGLQSDSIDLVISNCVINLSPNKEQVFRELFRVLKPGGELYFSDVFADRRIPHELAIDPVLRGECLGGAMYIEDFRRLLARLGCYDYRLVTKSRLSIENHRIEQIAGMIRFYSMTLRTFKLPFEDICENYGHVAFYRGGIAECPHDFPLDDHHLFQKGLPVPVCGNTALMLTKTRLANYFDVLGDCSTHYGAFDCAPDNGDPAIDGACC